MNILVSTNKNYIEQLIVLLKSIYNSNRNNDFDLYVLHMDLPSTDENNIIKNIGAHNIRFYFIKIVDRKIQMLPDQDIISAVYSGKIGLIDAMKYNLSDRFLKIYNYCNKEKIDLEWI